MCACRGGHVHKFSKLIKSGNLKCLKIASCTMRQMTFYIISDICNAMKPDFYLIFSGYTLLNFH